MKARRGPCAGAVDAGRRDGAALARGCSAAATRSHVFAYRGRSPYEANVEALARFAPRQGALRRPQPGRRADARHAESPPRDPGRRRRCCSARRCAVVSPGGASGARALGRWMMGACRALWEERARALDARRAARRRRRHAAARPRARRSAALPGPNDGVVLRRGNHGRGHGRRARWCARATACSSCRDRSAAWSSASSLRGDSHEAASWRSCSSRADRRLPVLCLLHAGDRRPPQGHGEARGRCRTGSPTRRRRPS